MANMDSSTYAHHVPALGSINLDHVAHFVPDMEGASRTLDELGFILTPFSPQANKNEKGELVPAGTANRCAMFEQGFLEILTPIADTPLAGQLRAAIARHS